MRLFRDALSHPPGVLQNVDEARIDICSMMMVFRPYDVSFDDGRPVSFLARPRRSTPSLIPRSLYQPWTCCVLSLSGRVFVCVP